MNTNTPPEGHPRFIGPQRFCCRLGLNLLSFKEQMTLHAISNFNRDDSYTNIAPNSRWTVEDYEGLHYYIRKGFLVDDYDEHYPDSWCVGEWDGERPLWDIGMEIETD